MIPFLSRNLFYESRLSDIAFRSKIRLQCNNGNLDFGCR